MQSIVYRTSRANLQTVAQWAPVHLISVQAPAYKSFPQSSQASQICLENEMEALMEYDFLIGI